jgi:hypothetical protein
MEFIVDSSARDTAQYPSSCKFKYPIPEITDTINKIKLSGISIPRSETNVNSSNYVIPFNTDDSVSGVKISDKGYGFVAGVYRSDGANPTVIVSDPGIYKNGTLPVCEAVFSNGLLDSVVIKSKGNLLFDGRYTRTVTGLDVGAEPGAVDAEIVLVVEDGFLEDVIVQNQGDDWVFGVNNYGDVNYNTGLIYQRAGVKAVIEVTINADSFIDSVTIENPGKGYVIGSYGSGLVSGCRIELKIPFNGDNIRDGILVASVGTLRLAELRYGQYGVDSEHDGVSGLCREVTRALQKASSPSFFPYTVLDDNQVPISVGSCSIVNSNPNAVLSKKIVIRRGETTNTNGNSAFLELLFGTHTESNSANSLLGFGATSGNGTADSLCGLSTEFTLFRDGFILPDFNIDLYYQDLGVIGSTIFNLNDTPNYVVVKLLGNESLKRFKSQNQNLDGGSFVAVFKTGIDNVYSNQIDSQTQKLDILGNDSVIVNPAKKMSHLDIEIVKPNGDLYGTTRDILLIFELNGI